MKEPDGVVAPLTGRLRSMFARKSSKPLTCLIIPGVNGQFHRRENLAMDSIPSRRVNLIPKLLHATYWDKPQPEQAKDTLLHLPEN